MAVSAMRGTAALLLAAVVLLAVSARAQDVPPEHSIASFAYAGSGCPPGTGVGEISKDGLVLTMKFSEFSASTDMGVQGKRKNCQISLKLRYTSGYTVGLEMITLRGYARLEEKVKGLHKVSYYVQGQKGTASFSKSTVGDFDDNYEYTGPLLPALFCKCFTSRNLNINMEVRVDNSADPAAAGFMDVDTADVVVVFELKWKKCP